jgi:hypothetical protein
VALNATTYADMPLRGRPPSSVPAQVAGELADSAGVDLGSDETRQNRESGLGALSGYVVGLAIGTAYGPHTAAPGESVQDAHRRRARARCDGRKRRSGRRRPASPSRLA